MSPAGIYPLNVNNRSTRTKCEICSKLTIKTPEGRQWRHSGAVIYQRNGYNGNNDILKKAKKSSLK